MGSVQINLFLEGIVRNPNFPNVHDNKPPALEGKSTSKIVSENLAALHAARQAFIESESSEKIRRALRYQTRSHGDVAYFTGDDVYYKRGVVMTAGKVQERS